MYYLNEILPETGTWVIVANKESVLPEGKYAFLERYCGNPACHCRACVIDIQKVDEDNKAQDESTAYIHYKWDEKISDKNPMLVEKAKQSSLAPMALKLFKEMIRVNRDHTDRLKTNYEAIKKHFKKMVALEAVEFVDSSTNKKANRNDPCPCGSGKKYKKCCINA